MKEISESDIIHLQVDNANIIGQQMLFNFIMKME